MVVPASPKNERIQIKNKIEYVDEIINYPDKAYFVFKNARLASSNNSKINKMKSN